MDDYRVLRLLDKIRFLFIKMGIDYEIMRHILRIKLTMDDRRVPSIFNQTDTKKNKEQKNSYIKSLWIYVVIGLVIIPFIGFGENYLFQMSMAYTMLILIIMTTMIADFSSVLLDVRDRSILSTKPIDAKTINAAKFIHILIYLTYLTVALTAIPLIIAFINQGILFVILTLFELLLINVFIVVLTAILYMFILRFFDGEKLKDLINYVQIGLSLVLMVGYQFLIRSFEFTDFNIVIEYHWWSIFLIPMWFAAPYELLLNGDQSFTTVGFSIISIVMPIVSIWLYIKLIPTFERNLQKLLSTSKSKKVKNNHLLELLLKSICRTSEERAFYRFSALMMKQERDFKLKVYPSLGFSFIFPLIFIFNRFGVENENISKGIGYLSIYFSMLIIPTALVLLDKSGNYKAAWIYKTFPLKDYAILKKGSLKAFLIKLYLPLYIVLSVIFAFIYGIRIIPDLLTVFMAACLYAVICFKAFGSKIPFAKPYDDAGNVQNWKVFIAVIPVGIMALIHFVVAMFVPYGVFIYLLVVVIINSIAWKLVFRKG